MRIDPVAYDHPHAAALRGALSDWAYGLYADYHPAAADPADFAPPRGLFLVGYVDDEPVVSGGWRPLGAGIAEIKAVYVVPHARGRGLARTLLAELERTAAGAGRGRIALMTGDKQLEAVALYRSCGYTDAPPWGDRLDMSLVYLAKDLVS